MLHMLDDLYLYNDWANQKVLELCDGLDDAQLDAPRELGFGSLRATLFHILAAEQIWLERWELIPWRPFPKDPGGMDLTAMTNALAGVSAARREHINRHRDDAWQVIAFEDSRKLPFSYPLFDLLLHVANHGIHHRAQALNYLKTFGRTVPVGIDYLLYRLATTTVAQPAESIAGLTAHGLAVAQSQGQDPTWEPSLVGRLFAYHDWATENILRMAEHLGDELLDANHGIGQGSIRGVLIHLYEGEKWWLQNWTTGPSEIAFAGATLSIAKLRDAWSDVALRRNAYLESVDADQALRVIMVSFGGPPMGFRVYESAIQLVCHGTHHRAQVINMLRHSGVAIRNLDLLYAIAELPAQKIQRQLKQGDTIERVFLPH